EVVVSDDGLQHPGLERTLEVAVFDERGAGNRRLLPAGPLREPLSRAGDCDAILLNATDSLPGVAPSRARFRFDLRPGVVRALRGGETLTPAAFVARFAPRKVAALAGIGHPERFFAALRELGLRFEGQAPGDHARIDAGTLAGLDAEVIVMTGKDAVKCAQFADERCWVFETQTRIDPAFINWIEERLRGYPTA
ncbi:MAG: tetraacyldisaccharide 4'-kinase, partial [Burkholderiaceae bacterium]|nr:tetraacyldisaccharide 4'-kinase [Burkholderiaceae bacterium]